MKSVIVLFAVIISTGWLVAQSEQTTLPKQITVDSPERYIYDDDLLSKEFHAGRRDALRALMDSNSVAVFFSSSVKNRSNDVNYEYHQDPNFYYLTGLNEPHAMLLVFKDVQDFDSVETNEILYLQDRDVSKEVWDGRRLGTLGADKVLGIKTAYPNNYFADARIDFSRFSNVYYILPEEDVRDDDRDRGDLFSLIRHFKLKGDTCLDKLNEMKLKEGMARLREIKQTEELTLMINAIDFTCEAQKELMRVVEPGFYEYEAEAVIEYVFKQEGAEYPGFPSILGGGENSCILHYVSNRRQLKDGDVLVSDIGAEYHGYTADVTRTMPVNGKFSKEQAIIYNLVLKAQTEGIKVSKAGNRFWEPNDVAKEIITQGLRDLGIINEPKEVRNYFMHGTSHYLGLDVHDVGLYGNFVPGNVITVEPGVYIPEGADCDPKWWNIGVRIEDDVLITDHEPEVLSGCVPKTIEEIEAIMQESPKIFK